MDGLHHIHKALQHSHRRHQSRDLQHGSHFVSSRQVSCDNDGGTDNSNLSGRRQRSHDSANDVIDDNANHTDSDVSISLSAEQVLDVRLDGFKPLCHLSHARDVTQLIPLQISPAAAAITSTNDVINTSASASNDVQSVAHCMVYDVNVTHGRKVVTLRSPLQVGLLRSCLVYCTSIRFPSKCFVYDYAICR